MSQPSPPMRLPAVKAVTGLSKSEIYRRMDAGTFPRQRKLSPKKVVWPEDEVLAWRRRNIDEVDLSELLG